MDTKLICKRILLFKNAWNYFLNSVKNYVSGNPQEIRFRIVFISDFYVYLKLEIYEFSMSCNFALCNCIAEVW